MKFNNKFTVGAFSLLALGLQSTAFAEDQPPMTFVPTGGWSLVEQPDTCLMTRDFASGGHKMHLQIESWASDVVFRLSVISNDLETERNQVNFAFLPGEPGKYEAPVYARMSNGDQGVIFNAGIMSGSPKIIVKKGEKRPDLTDDDFAERERSIKQMFVGDAFSRDVVLDTGPMRGAILSLSACLASVLRKKGIDTTADLKIAKPAGPKNEEAWVRRVQQSYPERMAEQKRGAQLQFRLIINKQGEVTDCFVLPEGQPDDFAKAACRTTQNEPFVPAHDAEGNPIASIYTTRITYWPG